MSISPTYYIDWEQQIRVFQLLLRQYINLHFFCWKKRCKSAYTKKLQESVQMISVNFVTTEDRAGLTIRQTMKVKYEQKGAYRPQNDGKRAFKKFLALQILVTA